MRSRSFVALAFAAVLALLVTAAGCGSSNNNSSTTASLTATPGINVKADPAAVAALPASVKKSGTLTVAADATYPPDEFIGTDGKTIIGMDADMAKALAQAMGLKANVENVTFDAILPGLTAKKYDLGMSSFTDTKERQKTVDFVTYAQAGTSFYVKASGGPNITSLDQLCGHKVAAETGTTQVDDANAQSKKCTAAGKPAVSVESLKDQNGANLAVSSGRADVGMADSPVADYIVKKSNGQLKLSGKAYGVAPYGIAMPKGSGLTQPVLAAVKAIMADGTYKKILDYWGLRDSAISNPQINGATS